MMNNLAIICLTLFLGTLFLVSVSVCLLAPGRKDDDGGVNRWTRFLLVCLRLAIGWHFVFEAADKLGNPNWSSEPYLRESVGPLAPLFRGLAGDRLVDQLTVGPDNSFPPALEPDWQAYVDTLTGYYELDREQTDRAHDVFRQAKSKFATWATVTKQSIELIAAAPPPVKEELTIPQRLAIYGDLEQVVRVKEEEVASKGKEAFEPLKTAKGNLAKWRAGLKKDLERQTDHLLKKPLRELLVGFAKDDLPSAYRDKIKDHAELREAVRKQYLDWEDTKTEEDKQADLSPRAKKIRMEIIEAQAKEREKKEPDPRALLKKVSDPKAKVKKIPDIDLLDPLPPTVVVARPLAEWSVLDASDWVVKHGLLAVGLCLVAGFMTRLACLGGAVYLLMFFLAMPPLAGWPDPPRAEGHYLLINKNIIEMLALLALATTRSGRWAGLDGLLQFLRPSRWRSNAEPVKLTESYQEPVGTGR